MTTVFSDHKGVLLVDFLDRDYAVNAKCDCGTTERLRHAIHQKRPGLLIQSIITSQDNARFDNTNSTCDRLRRYGWEIMNLPSRTSSLASGDLHPSGPHTNDLVEAICNTRRYEASCHLLTRDTWYRFLLRRDPSLGVPVRQKLKSQLWLCGGLMCIIYYPRAIEVRIKFSACPANE